MNLSPTTIAARLADLRKQADLYRQQYNMTLGAIAECEFWLTKATDVPPDPPQGDR